MTRSVVCASALVALIASSASAYAQEDNARRLNLDVPAQAAAPTPAEPEHTGLAAILYTTADDFKTFPRRQSTWVILAIGGAAAAAAHPIDDSVNERLTGSPGVSRIFAPGKWIGSAYVQVGTAAGLYAIGRYALPHADGEPRTN